MFGLPNVGQIRDLEILELKNFRKYKAERIQYENHPYNLR